MRRIVAEDVNQPLVELINEIDDDGAVIMKDGEPVARLTKFAGDSTSRDFSHLVGSLKHKIKVHGDIYSTGVHYPEDCHRYVKDEE